MGESMGGLFSERFTFLELDALEVKSFRQQLIELYTSAVHSPTIKDWIIQGVRQMVNLIVEGEVL